MCEKCGRILEVRKADIVLQLRRDKTRSRVQTRQTRRGTTRDVYALRNAQRSMQLVSPRCFFFHPWAAQLRPGRHLTKCSNTPD